jgi:tetratricopeptide (TPR) repeat protein
MPFFEATRAAVMALNDPALIVHHLSLEGSASISAWDWARGAALLSEAEVLLRERCPDDPWSRTLVRYHLGAAWYHLGDAARLAEHAELWLREARERQDHFGVALLAGMGMGSVRHLMRGDPDAALDELDTALARIPAEPFSFPHFGHMLGVQLALTMKGGSAALEWLAAQQRRLDQAFLLRTRMGRDSRQFFTVHAKLRAYDTMDSAERREALNQSRRAAAQRIQARAVYPRALGHLAMAQLDALQGQHERALYHAREAEQLYVQIRYVGASPASYLLGLLEGRQSGRERCEAVLRSWAAQGWRDPRRALCLAIPALPCLEHGAG